MLSFIFYYVYGYAHIQYIEFIRESQFNRTFFVEKKKKARRLFSQKIKSVSQQLLDGRSAEEAAHEFRPAYNR